MLKIAVQTLITTISSPAVVPVFSRNDKTDYIYITYYKIEEIAPCEMHHAVINELE